MKIFDNINSAELRFYLKDESEVPISLSSEQLKAVIKILGFQVGVDDTYSCFSDKGLKDLYTMKGNPLRLQEVD